MALEYEQFNPLDNGTGYALVSGYHLDRRLPLLKLRVGDERQRGIGPKSGSVGEFVQTARGRLIDPPMFREHKPVGFEHGDGALNRRELPADLFGSRPEAKQRRESIELVAETSSHENVASRGKNPAQLTRAGPVIENVMPDLGQPGEVAAVVFKRDELRAAGDIRKPLRLSASLCRSEHRGRRLHSDHVRLEHSGEQFREPAGPRTEIEDSGIRPLPNERGDNRSPRSGSLW